MLVELVRRYIARPIATLAGRIPFEPVVVAGLLLQGILFFRDQLSGGADLETALTSSIIALGTWIVRSVVWPAARIDATTGTPEEPLEAPITGLDY